MATEQYSIGYEEGHQAGWNAAMESLPAPVQQEPGKCGTCGNTYLAVRTDIYKDKREFVYCDCCGAMADRKTWNRPELPQPAQRKPQFKEFIKWAGAQGYDCAQTCNSDTGEWICLNPMTADLWKAWQAAHGIGEKK